jgi:glycosyltransferase involved in cell wall biosynthesis
MKKPLISVIIPIYNVEQYLKTCIDSVLAQSYENLEIILVDDGSQDSCGAICDEYANLDSRIIVIHKKNGGLSDARNKGIDICHGEYISFIDSDDFVSKYFIELLYNAAEETNSDIASYSWPVNFVDGQESNITFTEELKSPKIKVLDKKEALKQILYQKIPNGAQHRLYKKKILKDIRFPYGYLFEDVATVYKTFILANKIVLVSERAYAYRVRPDSIVRMRFSEKKLVSIPISKTLYGDIVSFDDSLRNAVSARAFSINFQVFLQVDRTDTNNMILLWNEIKKYNKNVLSDNDPYLRKKNKCAAIISLCGMRMSHCIGRMALVRSRKFIENNSEKST